MTPRFQACVREHVSQAESLPGKDSGNSRTGVSQGSLLRGTCSVPKVLHLSVSLQGVTHKNLDFCHLFLHAGLSKMTRKSILVMLFILICYDQCKFSFKEEVVVGFFKIIRGKKWIKIYFLFHIKKLVSKCDIST